MNRFGTSIRLTLAAVIVAAFLMLAPSQASAQFYYPGVPGCYTPTTVYYPQTTLRYSPATSSYYSVPITTYYAPSTVVTPAYSYSFYAPPAVSYYAPSAVYTSPAVTNTTYYRGGILFPRRTRVYSSTTYYTPGFFRY